MTVFYNPGSSNSLSCAIMGSSIGCCELKVIQLTGEQKGEAFVAVNPYGQVPGMSDESNGLNLGESTAILRYLAQQYKPSLYPGTMPSGLASTWPSPSSRNSYTNRGTWVKILEQRLRRRVLLRPGRPLWHTDVALSQGSAGSKCGLRRCPQQVGRPVPPGHVRLRRRADDRGLLRLFYPVRGCVAQGRGEDGLRGARAHLKVRRGLLAAEPAAAELFGQAFTGLLY